MRWSSSAVLAALIVMAAGPVAAQESDDDRARMHFDAGRSHYDEGAYDRARAEFLRAWELSQRAPLLLNLATVNERLANYDEAADNLERFLQLEPGNERAEMLRRRIQNLRRLARERAPAPDDPAPPLDGQADTRPAPRPTGSDDGVLIGGAVSLAVGGVGLALWGIFGGLTMAEDSAIASGCGATVSCSRADVANLAAYGIAADVGLGVGLAGVAVGAVLVALALASGGTQESASALQWNGRNLSIRF